MSNIAVLLTVCATLSAPPVLASISNAKSDAQAILEKGAKIGRPTALSYQDIHKKLGEAAVPALMEIVRDEHASDQLRWVSIFGVAKIGGRRSSSHLRNLLSDKHWMLRDAALKASAALNLRELAPQIEKRLHDDALIVRTSAVQAIGQMQLTGLAPKLVDSLFDRANYYGNSSLKALWIHKYILQTLSDFHYTASVPKLVELLGQTSDAKLEGQIIAALESLTGKSFPKKSIEEQKYLWKRNTVSELTF